MDRWKNILKKLLRPGWGWVVLIVILSAIALFLAFGTHLRETPFTYAAYGLSAYELTVFVAAVVPVLLRAPGFLHSIPLAHRYMTDKYFSVWYGLVSAISKCRFSPKWNVVFCWAAYRCYTALYATLLADLKPVKP